MDGAAPVHNAIVHVPVGVALVLPLVALAVLVGSWKARGRLGPAILLALQAALLAGCLLGLRSGEPAEDIAEDRGASGDAIHEHEERAEKLAWTAGLVTALAAAALIGARSKAGRPLLIAAAIATLPQAGLAGWTGLAGGDIAHPKTDGARPEAGADAD